MKNKMLYTSMIATIALVLFSSVMLDIKAESNENSAVKTEGEFATYTFNINDEIGGLIDIRTMANSDKMSVFYQYQDAVNNSSGFLCTGDSSILKLNNGLSQSSIKLNTEDLDCLLRNGPNGIIMLTVDGHDSKKVKSKVSSSFCSGDKCFKIHGMSSEKNSVAEGTFFGNDVTISGKIGTEKSVITHSNSE